MRSQDPKPIYDQVAGPKVSPGATVLNGAPMASSVFIQTVFPHQLMNTPSFGSCSEKKITIRAIATPESKAAERM